MGDVHELGVGAPVVRAFPFAFDSPGILTAGGCPLYVPDPGDLLLDAWIEIETVWDGTTPLGDIGLFGASKAGLWATTDATLTLTTTPNMDDAESATATGLSSPNGSLLFRLGAFTSSTVPGGLLPAKFVTVDAICVCVSQTGVPGGANPVSSQGKAILYLVTCTPVLG